MRQYRTAVSMFAAAIMLTSLLTVILLGISDESSADSGSCGDGLTYTFDDHILTITYDGVGTGVMSDYIPWCEYGNNIYTVNLPDGLTVISNNGFKGVVGITSIEIPDSVTKIGSEAFMNCTSLEKAVIGSGVKEIGDRAFSECIKLTDVTVKNGSAIEKVGEDVFYSSEEAITINVDSGSYRFPDSAIGGKVTLEYKSSGSDVPVLLYVGIVIVALLVIGGIVFFFIRRKN